MQTTIRRSLPTLALALVLAAAGCGGNGKKERQSFLDRANALCSHFEALQNNVQFPTGNPLAADTSHVTRAQWGLALNQIVNYGRQEIRGLQKLKAPKDLRDTVEQMIAKKETGYDQLAKGADAAKRNHPGEINAPVAAGRKALAEAAVLANKAGLPQCT